MVHFEPLKITLRLSDKAPASLPQNLQALLKKATEETWTIAISDEMGQPTLNEKEKQRMEEKKQAILQDLLVKSLNETFPGTTLVHFEDQ